MFLFLLLKLLAMLWNSIKSSPSTSFIYRSCQESDLWKLLWRTILIKLSANEKRGKNIFFWQKPWKNWRFFPAQFLAHSFGRPPKKARESTGYCNICMPHWSRKCVFSFSYVKENIFKNSIFGEIDSRPVPRFHFANLGFVMDSSNEYRK